MPASSEVRRRHIPVRHVVIDAGDKRFPGALQHHVADGATPCELGNDEIALGVDVVRGRVSELEGELGEGEAGVPRSRPDPERGFANRWTIGVQPEFRIVQRFVAPLQAQRPEADVMALARAHVDRLLEADVLSAPEQKERAERRGGVGPVEHEGHDHPPGAGQIERRRFRPARREKGGA